MSKFKVTKVKNKLRDADDPGKLKSRGPFKVHYNASSGQGALGYGQAKENLGTVDKLEIWAERNGRKKKSKIEFIPNDSNFKKSCSDKVWTVTYGAAAVAGMSRNLDDEAKNVQVVVGMDDQ